MDSEAFRICELSSRDFSSFFKKFMIPVEGEVFTTTTSFHLNREYIGPEKLGLV